MQQYKEAMEDIDTILAQDPEDESAILLRGKIEEATGDKEKAESSYQKVTELNPFNEQAFLYLGSFTSPKTRWQKPSSSLRKPQN